MQINAMTKVCASLAKPNKHTTAPIMHNAGFGELGINFLYLAFEPADIGEAMAAVRTFNFVGVSVSKPYKESVIAHIDELDPTARDIGAVNVVQNIEGKLVGYNSDWIGAVGALKERCSLEGKRAAVLGSGGAARAVVFGLLHAGCEVHVFSRRDEPGRRLADDMGAVYGGGLSSVEVVQPDILVNATSVGRGADDGDLPVPDSVFESAKTVMDIVVRRDNSRFLDRAAAAGAATIGGVRMLVLQGVFAFELFTGQKAPVETMQRAVVDALA